MSINEEAAMEHDEQSQGSTTRPGADRPDPSRRNFLKAAPLGALAVVAAGAQAAEPAAPPPVAESAQTPRGYHETEHIRRYYQTAAYW
jgi:hypothetical protein